ncbi:MAG: Hsp33 family molecular chaperone HslO [Psittacicella sp.]
MNNITNEIRSFLFKDSNINGRAVRLSSLFDELIIDRNFPEIVKSKLLELLVLSSLISSTLKFEGDMTIQIQGTGPLNMLVVNGTNNYEYRASARYITDEDVNDQNPISIDQITNKSSLHEIFGSDALLVISVLPKDGRRYQSFVQLDNISLTSSVENYYKTSEQIDTKFIIKTSFEGRYAFGIMIQAMPRTFEHLVDIDLEELYILSETIKEDEILTLDIQTILYRLFNEHDFYLYESNKLKSYCTCSREKSLNTLNLFPYEELLEILEESNGDISMTCEYCDKKYSFSLDDINTLKNIITN